MFTLGEALKTCHCSLIYISIEYLHSHFRFLFFLYLGHLAKNLYSRIKYWVSFTAPNTHIHQVRNGMCRFMNSCREKWILCWLNCIGHHSQAMISCSSQSPISVPECLILISFSSALSCFWLLVFLIFCCQQ